MRNVLPAAGLLWALPGAAPASAHAFLQTAVPAVGATLQQAPTEVLINFTASVEPAFSTMTVTNASGMQVDTGKAHLAGGDTHLAIGVKKLPPGIYLVSWHVTATDTHKTEGTFRFTIKP